jgi:hypothetical protein
MGMVGSFCVVGMGFTALTIIKGLKKRAYFIDGSLRIIIHEHDLNPQHNPFKGDIFPPNAKWVS